MSQPISASQCLAYAKSLMESENIILVDNQGCNSYNLICPNRSKITYFSTIQLDTKIIEDAGQISGALVPQVTFHAGFILPVYTSDVAQGQLHLFQPVPRSSFPVEREMTTVIDLAKFITRSSHFAKPGSSYKDASWTNSTTASLGRLVANTSLQKAAPEVSKILESFTPSSNKNLSCETCFKRQLLVNLFPDLNPLY